METRYFVGIPGPNTEYFLGEPNSLGEQFPAEFDDIKEAEAKAAELGEGYEVIPFTHHEAGE